MESFQERWKRVVKFLSGLVLPTRDAIGKHVARVRREAREGKKPKFRSLKERTGLEFGSGSARAFRRRHAKRVLALAKRGLV